MAEAVVSIVVEHLADLLLQQAKEEIDLLIGVEDKVRNLSKTFKRIQAVLVDAERKWVDENVKIWLKELEDVSYEIDDVLDEWNYQILRKQIEGRSSSSSTNNNASTSNHNLKQRVRSFVSSSCFCFNELVVNREIAIKIRELNAKLDFIAKEKEKFKFEKTSTVSQEWEPFSTPSTSLVDESNIFGRENDKKILLSKLLPSESDPREEENRPAIQIVSITGAGGIGKTTIAQLVYNDEQVKSHFEKRGWVSVSNSFEEIRIAKAILEALHSSSSNLNEFNSLLERIRDSVLGKKFLLVFDNVWTEDPMKWQPFDNALKYGAPGSAILLTTRSEEVARVAGATCTIALGVLSESDSWSLFCKEAFPGRRAEIERATFHTIGKEINRKCNGLPLAIKTLGSLLSSKTTLEAWQQVRDSNMWELDVAEVQLFPHIYLSYIDLPSSLKRCFSYCAVFHKDYRIDVDGLINAWLGQGYLNSTKNKDEMELKGREYFDYLAKRSFFQDLERDHILGEKVVSCKMHDIMHDFAQFLMKSECFIIKGQKKETLPNNVHHLTWLGSEDQTTTSSEEEEATDDDHIRQLRSFFANNLKLDSFRMTNWLNNLKLVRVLKFSGCHFKVLSKEIQNLIHLRFLGVCDNDELMELPTTIYDLYNLQILDVSGCWKLTELPPGIEKLKNLRHFFPSRTDMRFPEGIGKLTCLQTLTFFIVKGDEHNKLGYLKSLNQLRGSLYIQIAVNLDMADVKVADLKSKLNIQYLTIKFSGSIMEKEDVMETLEPPPRIQMLCMIHYRGTRLATWITALKYLRHLNLKLFYELTSLPALGVLPLLEKLEIEYFYKLKSVDPSFLGIRESLLSYSAGFPMLEELGIISCKKWEEWEDITPEEEEDDTIALMPRLRWLTIGECPKLKSLPYRLLHKAASLVCIQFDEKKYNPSTILSRSTTLAPAEIIARKPDYQSTSIKEALQLKRLQKVIADVWSNDNNLQLMGTSQFNELPHNKLVPNEEIIRSGVISRFVEFLAREDFPLLQFQAVQALKDMVGGTSDNMRVVIDHGALSNLVKLIGSPRDDIRDLALVALSNIACQSREFRDLILEHETLIPLLLQLNEHADVMMLRRKAWILFSLCYPNESQFEQIKQLLPTLHRLMYSHDEEVLKYACDAFAELSNSTSDNIQVVIEAGICQRLVELLLHPTAMVLIPALEAIGNIAGGDDVQTQCIIDEGELPHLLRLLSSNHEESSSYLKTKDRNKIQYHAARALAIISGGTSKNREVLIDHGGVPIFVKLLESPSEDVCYEALWALGNITEEDDVQTQCIIDHGALTCLLSLLTQNHKNIIKENACWVIYNITTRNRDQTQAVIEAGLISPLISLLKTAEFDTKKWAARAISNVTYDVTHEQMKFLVSEGCIKPLCDLLECPELKIASACLRGLRNILEVGEEVEKNQGSTRDANDFAQMIEEAQGLEKIKNLQDDGGDDKIREIAGRILEKYWLDN